MFPVDRPCWSAAVVSAALHEERTSIHHDPFLSLAGVLSLGVGAQWLAWRFRVPSILLLLTFGFAAGQSGLLDPDDLLGGLLVPVVSLSVAVILFEGGLTIHRDDLPRVGRIVRNLISLGAVVTVAVTTWAGVVLLGLELPVALLIGAILMVTGPTVIGPLLRHVRPAGETGSILHWEGILIDPIGATVAVRLRGYPGG